MSRLVRPGLARALAPLALAALFLGALRLRGAANAHLVATTAYEDIYYLPPPGALRVAALGHDAALADLLWIRALIYTGDEYTHLGGLRYVFAYTDALLTLDPDFRAVYHWIASAGTYQPEAITIDEVQATLAILERGVARFPDDGELAWDLGATYAFELPAFLATDEERADARLRASPHLMRAARLGAAPPWMMLSNATLLSRIGRAERAVEHLEEMYATVDDPSLRAQIAARIAALRTESHASAFVEMSEAEEGARLRAYPWVHPAMYHLLGPRPAVDVAASLRDGFAAHAFDEGTALEDVLLDDDAFESVPDDAAAAPSAGAADMGPPTP